MILQTLEDRELKAWCGSPVKPTSNTESSPIKNKTNKGNYFYANLSLWLFEVKGHQDSGLLRRDYDFMQSSDLPLSGQMDWYCSQYLPPQYLSRLLNLHKCWHQTKKCGTGGFSLCKTISLRLPGLTPSRNLLKAIMKPLLHVLISLISAILWMQKQITTLKIWTF